MRIEELNIPAVNKKRIVRMIGMYKQNGIVIEPVSFENNRLIVRAEQKYTPGKILTRAELTDRVRELFAGEIPGEWKLTVSAVDFDRADIESVDAGWVVMQMDRHKMKAKHLCNRTGIDKSTMSALLKSDSKRVFTKWHKVAFYYLFKNMDIATFNKPVEIE